MVLGITPSTKFVYSLKEGVSSFFFYGFYAYVLMIVFGVV